LTALKVETTGAFAAMLEAHKLEAANALDAHKDETSKLAEALDAMRVEAAARSEMHTTALTAFKEEMVEKMRITLNKDTESEDAALQIQAFLRSRAAQEKAKS